MSRRLDRYDAYRHPRTSGNNGLTYQPELNGGDGNSYSGKFLYDWFPLTR